MPKNRLCRFLCSEYEYELIKAEAKSRGYKHLSAYVRDLAIRHNRAIEDKIIETHKLVKMLVEKKE